MSLLSRSLIAFGLLLASFASPLGTAVAANTADESSLEEATTKCLLGLCDLLNDPIITL